jgi:hypothetical protein
VSHPDEVGRERWIERSIFADVEVLVQRGDALGIARAEHLEIHDLVVEKLDPRRSFRRLLCALHSAVGILHHVYLAGRDQPPPVGLHLPDQIEVGPVGQRSHRDEVIGKAPDQT